MRRGCPAVRGTCQFAPRAGAGVSRVFTRRERLVGGAPGHGGIASAPSGVAPSPSTVGSAHGHRQRHRRRTGAGRPTWRAANYLTVGQIYLRDNPLLREPLRPSTSSRACSATGARRRGSTCIYAHLNRADPSHATVRCSSSPVPATAGRRWSPTSGSKARTPRSTPTSHATATGMQRLFRQFSTPGGMPSHVSVPTPGSIHEGGELGYALVHAFGAAFDNPDLVVACVIGDGEAETGAARGIVEGHRVPQPGARRRGAADPAPQRLQDLRPDGARPQPTTRTSPHLLRGHGYDRASSRATTRPSCTARSPPTLDRCCARIGEIQATPAPGAAAVDGAPALARASCCARRRGGPDPRWSTACRSRARSAPTRCRSATSRDEPGAPGHARSVDAQLPARGALRRRRPPGAGACWRSIPDGERRMGANPTRTAARVLVALELPDSGRLRAPRGGAGDGAARVDPRARRVLQRHLRARTRRPRTSACSVPTRRTRTGSARCSRSRTAAGSSADLDRPTTTSRPTAG